MTKGSAFEDQLIGGRLEAVDGGLSQQGIGHLGDPFHRFTVGRDESRRVAVPFHHQFVDVGGVQSIEGLEGEVVDLLRCRSKSTYPDLAIISNRPRLPLMERPSDGCPPP